MRTLINFIRSQAEWFTAIPAAATVWSYSDIIYPIFQSGLTIITGILTAIGVAIAKHKISKYLEKKNGKDSSINQKEES